MRKKRIATLSLLFLLVGSCLCFGAILTPTGTQAAPNIAGLPTRTTPHPTPLPTAIPPTSIPAPISTPIISGEHTGDAPGSQIKLRVALDSPDWQRWWTVVQWQDERGDWHDVTGWQGILDGVLKIDQLDYGTKLWWVEKKDTDSGPFRWLVYPLKGQGAVGSKSDNRGTCPMSSAPFNLPAIGQFATMHIALREPTRFAPQIESAGRASLCLAEGGAPIAPSGAGMSIARQAGLPSCKNGRECDCAMAQQAWPDMDLRLQMAMSRALCEPSYEGERP
jgi:hypothetical protein